MSGFNLFSHLYSLLSRRRTALFLAAGAVIILSMILLRDIRLSEDIKSMLPDNQEAFSLDFELLQHAPFTRKIIINLRDTSSKGDTDRLIDTADRLAGAMTPPFFTRVVTGPSISQDTDLYDWLITNLPNLVTQEDLEEINRGLTKEQIRDQLVEDYDSLFSPEGWFLKGFISSDPLDLKTIGLKKLAFLNIMPNIRLQDNHFIDAEGRNLLMIAETDVDITDGGGAGEMLTSLEDLAKETAPSDMEMSVLGAHNYAAANARTIKRDLFVVLSISSMCMIFLFVFFLRNWRAFLVLLISFSSFSIALVSVSFIYKIVSAVTVGFGSVLLGLSDDLSLHVYFALRPGRTREKGRDTSRIMADVSRPVLFGGVITVSAFCLLLFSDLPGQRQLGAFAIIGVIAALAMSLTLLPQMMNPSPLGRDAREVILKDRRPARPSIVIALWILLLSGCALQARHISFSGDLNSLNFVPEELSSAEAMIRDTWGNFRGSAMIFSEGEDIESALETNDELFEYLNKKIGQENIISIAPVFPSVKTQQINSKAWSAFWADKGDMVMKIMEEEGKALGFSGDAFEPFFTGLKSSPQAILPGDTDIFGVREIVDSMIVDTDGKVSVLTLAPDTQEIMDIFAGDRDIPQGVRFVSQSHFSGMIQRAIGHDFIRFIIGAFLLILLLLVILFRNTKKVLMSLVPVLTGMMFMFGVMGLMGISFNIFNIISSILVIGLGVDFGIFMVCKCSEDYEYDTDTAVLLSGLTTITGFGALVFARHPALHSIGITVLLGIGAAIPSAMFVIPAFYKDKP